MNDCRIMHFENKYKSRENIFTWQYLILFKPDFAIMENPHFVISKNSTSYLKSSFKTPKDMLEGLTFSQITYNSNLDYCFSVNKSYTAQVI